MLGVIAVGAVLLATMGAITAFALTQRSEARNQARASKANELVAVSGAERARDPELSLALALEASRLDPSESSEQALRQALNQSRMRGVVDLGEPVVGAAPLGRLVLGVSESGELVEANPATGEILGRVDTGSPAADVSFSTDGTPLVTGRDGSVLLVRGGDAIAVPGVTEARAASISPDGSLAAVVEPRGVRLVDVESGSVLESYDHPGAISAAVSYDNRRVATGGADDQVHIWSGQSGRRVHTLTEHDGNAVALEFSPDGARVATASSDGVGRLFRTADWGLSSVVTGHTHSLRDIAFSSDSEHVVTAGEDGTAQVFHVDTGDQLVVLAGSDDWVMSAAFAGGVGSPIVTAGRDGTIRVWDSVFQPELELLTELPSAVVYVEFDDDGRLRATTDVGRAHILDPATGEVLEVVRGAKPRRDQGPSGEVATIRGKTVVLRTGSGTRTLEGHRDRVTGVDFSPDGALLVTSSRDSDARIWRVADGESIQALQHNTAVHDARFSPDGKWVVTAAFRGSLWDVSDGSNLLRLQGHDGTLTTATFDPTGHTVFTGGVDGTVRTYECGLCGGLDELVSLAEARLAATRRGLTPDERERYLR